MSLMELLHLNQDQIDAALPRVAVGLKKYGWLQTELAARDVSRDREFQTRFGGFYRVRRNAQWRSAFFEILEDAKSTRTPFVDALRRLQGATGRVEASFASKLVATVDPTQPVIDSVVLKNLGLKLPPTGTFDRIGRIADLHQSLARTYSAYLSSESGRRLVTSFHHSYPNDRLTEIKMLDLVLWQTRAPR